MSQNNNNEQIALSRDIQIAKLAYIGSAIAAIGDGLAALAAGLALDALENPIEDRSHNPSVHLHQAETTQRNLDAFIHELIQIRQMIR